MPGEETVYEQKVLELVGRLNPKIESPLAVAYFPKELPPQYRLR